MDKHVDLEKKAESIRLFIAMHRLNGVYGAAIRYELLDAQTTARIKAAETEVVDALLGAFEDRRR